MVRSLSQGFVQPVTFAYAGPNDEMCTVLTADDFELCVDFVLDERRTVLDVFLKHGLLSQYPNIPSKSVPAAVDVSSASPAPAPAPAPARAHAAASKSKPPPATLPALGSDDDPFYLSFEDGGAVHELQFKFCVDWLTVQRALQAVVNRPVIAVYDRTDMTNVRVDDEDSFQRMLDWVEDQLDAGGDGALRIRLLNEMAASPPRAAAPPLPAGSSVRPAAAARPRGSRLTAESLTAMRSLAVFASARWSFWRAATPSASAADAMLAIFDRRHHLLSGATGSAAAAGAGALAELHARLAELGVAVGVSDLALLSVTRYNTGGTAHCSLAELADRYKLVNPAEAEQLALMADRSYDGARQALFKARHAIASKLPHGDAPLPVAELLRIVAAAVTEPLDPPKVERLCCGGGARRDAPALTTSAVRSYLLSLQPMLLPLQPPQGLHDCTMSLWANRRTLADRLARTAGHAVGLADLLGACAAVGITSERPMLCELLRRAGMSRVSRVDVRVLAASVVAISNGEMRALSWLLTHAVQRGRELLLRHRSALLTAHAASPKSGKKGKGIGAGLFKGTSSRSHVISVAHFVALLRALPEKITAEVCCACTSLGLVSCIYPPAVVTLSVRTRTRTARVHTAARRWGMRARVLMARPHRRWRGVRESVVAAEGSMVHVPCCAVQEEAILLDWLPTDRNGTFDLAALLNGLRVINILDSTAPVDERVGALFCARRSRLLQLCLAQDPACTGAIPSSAFHAIFASACADLPSDVAAAVLARVAPDGAEMTMYAWMLNSFVILSTHLGAGEAAAAAAIAASTQVRGPRGIMCESRVTRVACAHVVGCSSGSVWF